jgi:hypothetical protein
MRLLQNSEIMLKWIWQKLHGRAWSEEIWLRAEKCDQYNEN